MLSRLTQLVKGTVREFGEDDCTHLAAGVAYYTLFSLFPLLLGLTAVLSLILDPEQVRSQLVALATNYLPGSGELVAETVTGVIKSRGSMGLVAVLGLFWSASAIFSAVRLAINRAWGVRQRRPFIRQKAIEFAMLVGAGFLFILSIGTTATYRTLSRLEIPIGGLGIVGDNLAWQAVGLLLPLVFSFAIFASVYRFLPNAPVAWRDVWLGALVASVAFELAKNGFAWYIQSFATYNLVYGSLAGVIVFLFWAYISAAILLFGAKLASRYARIFGTHSRE